MGDTTIQVMAHGPLRVTGAFELADATGAPFDLGGRNAVSLCRCGHSRNNPFCDGAHAAAGFRSDKRARALPPQKPRA